MVSYLESLSATTLGYWLAIALAGLIGLAIGWRFGVRHLRRLQIAMEQETGERSLELLETKQHLRKISSHLRSSLKKEDTIKQLRRKQKSLLREIDQHKLRARRQEKAHFIQTAKIKLELIESRIAGSAIYNGHDKLLTSAQPPAATRGIDKEFGQLNSETRQMLEEAGINRVRQLAQLSRQDIEHLVDSNQRRAAD